LAPLGCKLVGTVKGTKLWAGDCADASELRGTMPVSRSRRQRRTRELIRPQRKSKLPSPHGSFRAFAIALDPRLRLDGAWVWGIPDSNKKFFVWIRHI
jgi:hypothetical protein